MCFISSILMFQKNLLHKGNGKLSNSNRDSKIQRTVKLKSLIQNLTFARNI